MLSLELIQFEEFISKIELRKIESLIYRGKIIQMIIKHTVHKMEKQLQ